MMTKMTRDEQIAFMEGRRERVRGYVSDCMQYPAVRSALRYHDLELAGTGDQETAASDNNPPSEHRRMG
jgi:hypothetical protein